MLRILFLLSLCSLATPALATGGKLGDWVLLKNTTQTDSGTVEVLQRYALVGQERDEAGALLHWLEIEWRAGEYRFVAGLLVPQQALAQADVTTEAFYRHVRRWVVKDGDQPAVEIPADLAAAKLRQILVQASGHNEVLEEEGSEVLVLNRGTVACQWQRYSRQSSEMHARGEHEIIASLFYQRTVWQAAAIPIIGFARIDVDTRIELALSPAVPAIGFRPLQSRTTLQVVDFGQGAATALEEKPMELISCVLDPFRLLGIKPNQLQGR